MAQLEIRKGEEAELRVGGLRLVACRREVGELDGGVSLYVFGDLPGDDRELLRFDFFRTRPHYHAPAENRTDTVIEVDAHLDSASWGIEALTRRAPELLREGGFDEIAERLDGAALESAGDALRELLMDLGEPTQVSYFEIPKAVLDSLTAG
ncbi:MAG: hypothetical protein CL908_23610 [Deltaproteobacteria bacterium]|nr:hypothetical protein [Deltaproteobacteria bacterium]